MSFSSEDAVTENSCERIGKIKTEIDNYQHLRHEVSIIGWKNNRQEM